MIDPTDPFSTQQLLALKGSIRSHQANLPTGGKLSLFLLAPEDQELAPEDQEQVQALFSASKPKSGAQANEWKENRKLLDKAYGDQWTEALEAALAKLDATLTSHAESSPILEGLHALGQQADWGKGTVELEIWSDLMQKSDTLDQYATACRSYQDLLQGKSMYAQVPGLTGAQIRVYRLTNHKTGKPEPACHSAFWNDYFTQASGMAPAWQNL
ncbi:MAG: hypothetical protein ACRERU_11560 [Methylococcales bacterium]